MFFIGTQWKAFLFSMYFLCCSHRWPRRTFHASLFWTWFGFWGHQGVGVPVKSLQIVSLFRSRFSLPSFSLGILFSPLRTYRLRNHTHVQLNLILSAFFHKECNPSLEPLAFKDMISLPPGLGALNCSRFRDPNRFRTGIICSRLPMFIFWLVTVFCSGSSPNGCGWSVGWSDFLPHLGGILRKLCHTQALETTVKI